MLLKPKYQIVIAGLCLAIVAILSLMIGNTLVTRYGDTGVIQL